MLKRTGLTAILCWGFVTGGAMQAQQSDSKAPAKAMVLTAQDYIEIQQLVARYAGAIDSCSNNGYDYADLYTPDGYFAPSQNGRVGTKFQGRERLAEAAGGGVLGCKDTPTIEKRSHHLYANHVIIPTPDGATGTVEVLVAGRDGDRNIMEIQGHYEDVYTKTPAGWRFQSRIHVVPVDFRRRRAPSTPGSEPAQTPAR
jgi:hypothetical protein